jgi:hypothetical protein
MEEWRGIPVHRDGEPVGKVHKMFKGGDGELFCEMLIDDDDVKKELYEANYKASAPRIATVGFTMTEDAREIALAASKYRQELWSKIEIRGLVARDPETDPEKVQTLVQQLVERELGTPSIFSVACSSRECPDPIPESIDTQMAKLKLADD